MAYYSDIETDKRLAELEKKIAKEYRAANKDLTRTAQEYFEKFEKRYKKEYAAYQDGKYTKAQFDAWVKAQVMRGEHWQNIRDQAAERLTHTNTIAAAYINSDMPSIWALNFNYEGYRAEQELRGISFDIADEWTVRRLMTEEPDLLPTLPPEKAINIPKDQLWNRRKITQSVNAAIIRGQGVSELAKSFEHVVGMNRTSAIRNARTAYTGAQNGGRQQSYEALAAMGVDVEKQWIATLDGATRPSHMRLDGETVPYKDTFSNGLEYPGDPAGSPAEVYNCRCTMKAILDGNRNATRTRRARDENGENKIVENMTYTGQGRTVSYHRWINKKIETGHDHALYTRGDPLLEVTGDMKTVKPKEYLAIVNMLSAEGVAIINSGSPDRIFYQLQNGKAGIMAWPDKISEGAILHEVHHFEQDKKRGFAGFEEAMSDPRRRYAEEKEAYAIEIEIAEKLGRKDIATRLRGNLREERNRIFHG